MLRRNFLKSLAAVPILNKLVPADKPEPPKSFVTRGTAMTLQPDTGRYLVGKLDHPLAPGWTATVSVWTGPPGCECDSSLNVTARLPDCFEPVDCGKWVVLGYAGGQWHVIGAEA